MEKTAREYAESFRKDHTQGTMSNLDVVNLETIIKEAMERIGERVLVAFLDMDGDIDVSLVRSLIRSIKIE